MIKNKFKPLKDFLLTKHENNPLVGICARISVYNLVLAVILYSQCQVFDANEIIIIVMFSVCAFMYEVFFTKLEVGKRFIGQIGSFIMLVFFMFFLIQSSIAYRSAWFRNNILSQRVESIVGSAPAIVVSTDGLGLIKIVNKELNDVLGWEIEDLKDKPFYAIIGEDDLERYNKLFVNQMKSLKSSSVYWDDSDNKIFDVKTKNGKIIKCLIYVLGIKYSIESLPGKYSPGNEEQTFHVIQPINVGFSK